MPQRILQLDVLGSFDFVTCIPSFDAVASTDVLRLAEAERKATSTDYISVEEFAIRDRIQPLLAHEYTHFLDATSTLWGLRHLQVLDEAFRAFHQREESGFHAVKALDNHLRTLRLPAYYTFQGPSASADRPWKAQVSIGRRYTASGHIESGVPISFCRFESVTGELIVRSPLSPVSLLETSAMSEELAVRYALLHRLAPPDLVIEGRLQSKRTIDYLYRRDITEYSVCAHLVANHLRCSDGLAAFLIAGSLARWVLTAPDEAYEHVRQAAPLGALFSVSDADQFVVNLKEGLRGRDVGTLFHIVTRALPADAHVDRGRIRQSLLAALTSLNLDATQVDAWLYRAATQALMELGTSPSPLLRRLGAAGWNNLTRIRKAGGDLDFQDLHLPPGLFGDGETMVIWGLPGNDLARLDLDACIAEMAPLERFTRTFAEACV